MTVSEIVYVAAGVALPAYYLPQMAKCARDNTRLASYSMSKAGTQLVLRLAMLPFVFGVGNITMTCVVSLDFAGRLAEFAIAVASLHRQGMTWRQVGQRCRPLGRRDPNDPLAAAAASIDAPAPPTTSTSETPAPQAAIDEPPAPERSMGKWLHPLVQLDDDHPKATLADAGAQRVIDVMAVDATVSTGRTPLDERTTIGEHTSPSQGRTCDEHDTNQALLDGATAHNSSTRRSTAGGGAGRVRRRR